MSEPLSPVDAIALVNAWRMGMRDEVFVFLARQEALEAAYVASMVLGFLTAECGQAAGIEFLDALKERIGW